MEKNLLKLTKIFLFLTILSLPLYNFRWELFSIPTTLVENLIAATLVFWVGSLLKRGKEVTLGASQGLRGPIFWLIVIFILSSLISLLVSPNQRAGLGVFKAFIIEPILLFLISSDLLKRGTDYKKIIILPFALSAIGVSLLAVWQWFTQTNTVAPLEIAQGRVTSVYNNPNFLGLYLGPILGLISSNVFLNRKPVKETFLLVVAFFLIIFAVLLSKSLGAFLGLAGIGLLITSFYLYERLGRVFKKIIVYGWVSLVTLLLTSLVFLFLNINAFTPNYGLVYPRISNDTKVIRLCLWEGTLNLLRDRPILGAGGGGFPEIYKDYRTCDTEIFRFPHNLFLNFWVETGFFGLVSFLGLLAYLVRGVFENLKRDKILAIGLLSALIYTLIQGLVDVPYFKNDLSVQFWLLLSLAAFLKKKRDLST